MDHKIVFRRKLGERADIVRHVDRRRLRKPAAGGDVGVDIVRLDVYAVAQRPAVHIHVQRKQSDVVFFQLLWAEITGRI